MDETLMIRVADLDDINTIGFLAQQIWPDAYKEILSPEQLKYMLKLIYSPKSLRRQMVDEHHRFLLVEQDEEPIGFASWSATADPGVYKLHKIYVLPAAREKALEKRCCNLFSRPSARKARNDFALMSTGIIRRTSSMSAWGSLSPGKKTSISATAIL